MDQDEILKLIDAGEDQQLEFKVRVTSFGEDVCAFANTDGGVVLFGVSDDGKITGVGKSNEEKISSVAAACDPPVRPTVERLVITGISILIAHIERTGLIHSFKGKVYKRVGSTNRALSTQEILDLGQKLGKIRFDDQIVEEASFEDIDWDFVRNFFIPRYESRVETAIAGNPEEVMEALGATQDGAPTNAGILLFGKGPQGFYPNAFIALARYRGEVVGTERLDYKEFDGNLFQQIDACDRYIKEHIATMSRLSLDRVEREDIPEYPFFSIRELVTNAVVHRDYFVAESKVIIKMFSDHLEFYNPGGLGGGVTPENIVRKQFSRNPILARVLSRVGYIEELGEGWDKIIAEHRAHPLNPPMPAIEADETSVTVTLFSTREKFRTEQEFIELNKRQRQAVHYLETHGRITNREYRELFPEISSETARSDLKDMVEKGILEQRGAKRGTHYVLRQENPR